MMESSISRARLITDLMMISTFFHSLQQSQFAQDNVVILHSRCGGGQNLTVLDGEVAGEKDRQDAKGCVCVCVCVCVCLRGAWYVSY